MLLAGLTISMPTLGIARPTALHARRECKIFSGAFPAPEQLRPLAAHLSDAPKPTRGRSAAELSANTRDPSKGCV